MHVLYVGMMASLGIWGPHRGLCRLCIYLIIRVNYIGSGTAKQVSHFLGYSSVTGFGQTATTISY